MKLLARAMSLSLVQAPGFQQLMVVFRCAQPELLDLPAFVQTGDFFSHLLIGIGVGSLALSFWYP